ncbi:MAG: 4Fe-4S dicluster domain-containing protein [Spirochaetaceae bacterium]|nr:MAG: 4Fe-4S dicluster domain-containing protein [Spirochaetaceae bacterium]
MKQGTIRIDDLEQLIAGILKSFRMYAPVADGGGVALSELKKGQSPLLDYHGLKKPIKELFFPQSETILKSEGDALKSVPVREEKRIVFGIRPCDARALQQMDSVFADGEYRDPYYTARRRDTLILSLACREPQDICFCTSIGGGPFDERGSDVLMFKDADTLLFQACSSAGTSFLTEFNDHFKRPTAVLTETRKKAVAKARKKSLRFKGERLFDRLDGSLEPAFWDTLAWRCLGCAVCTYLCPTCHCFTFSDQSSTDGGERSRNWDACSLELFTREASGHNPRSSKGQRIKQRIMHKFRYAKENFGDTFCVGCGRCISNCPVNMDIREIIGGIIQ